MRGLVWAARRPVSTPVRGLTGYRHREGLSILAGMWVSLDLLSYVADSECPETWRTRGIRFFYGVSLELTRPEFGLTRFGGAPITRFAAPWPIT